MMVLLPLQKKTKQKPTKIYYFSKNKSMFHSTFASSQLPYGVGNTTAPHIDMVHMVIYVYTKKIVAIQVAYS